MVQPLPPERLERDNILQQIFNHIGEYQTKFNDVDFTVLKSDVLEPVIQGQFDPEVQIRGFLRAFQHTAEYKNAVANLKRPDLQAHLESFIQGRSSKEVVGKSGFPLTAHPSPPVKHHFSLLQLLKRIVLCNLKGRDEIEDIEDQNARQAHLKDLPVVYEDAKETKVMEVYSDVPFTNWGETVKNSPKYTFLPTTVFGIQNIVKYAKKTGRRVRCSGYRHSWSNIFSEQNEILVSFVNLDVVTRLPDPMSIVGGEYTAQNVPELKTIELKEQTSPTKRLCRVGAAVTNEEFRRWSVAGNAWTLPCNVIMVEITIGGSNAPICHGAGLRHKTLSDYVRRIEYVDCHGEKQTINDRDLIRAAAGAFGLLGVVTHVTFELDAMQYALLEPRKVDVGLAIPPVSKEDVPVALRGSWYDAPDSAAQLTAALGDFERRAAGDYYSEWFWFTYQQKVWVNTWNPTEDSTNVTSYPDDANVFLQWIEGWLGGVITSTALFQALPGYWQAQLLATSGMAALPPSLGEDDTPSYKTSMMNALHFRRGIQNMRVRDMEFQIPLQPRSDDPTKPDFTIVQRAWWDVVKLVYAEDESGESPMRLTLELRIMGGSDVVMAPQQGNTLGTASIEVLTAPDAVTDGEWLRFCQKVADLWMSYGDQINVRPHWAKEWLGVQMRGMDAKQYLKTIAYKDQIAEFKTLLDKIGEKHGWTLDELRDRFSNELWDEIIFED